MRNVISGLLGGIALCSLAAGNVRAATYFSDGFESQTDPLGAPPVGTSYTDGSGTSGSSYDLTSNAGQVFAGSKALKVLGSGTLIGAGTAGALVAGNTVQYLFHVNLLQDGGSDTANAFNNPIQISLGYSNGGAGTLARIGTLASSGDRVYGATNNGAIVNSSVVAPFGTTAYDTLRAVLTLTTPSAGMLGGTLDLFVSVDGGAEQQIAAGYALTAVPVIANDAPTFRLQRGGPTITTSAFYDDISVTSVPEPTAVALLAVGGVSLLRRRR